MKKRIQIEIMEKKPKKRWRDDGKINAMQEQFCQLYTKYWVAKRAAKEAGYSERSCETIGYALTQNPLVKARIKELTDHSMKEIGISRERVLSELSKIAFVDIGDAYGENGQILSMRDMPEDVRRAIGKVKVYEEFSGYGEDRTLIGFTKEVEFSPKKAALDSIGKHLGLFPDRLEHSGRDGSPIEHADVTNMTDEQKDARINALLKKRNSTPEEE